MENHAVEGALVGGRREPQDAGASWASQRTWMFLGDDSSWASSRTTVAYPAKKPGPFARTVLTIPTTASWVSADGGVFLLFLGGFS